MSVFNLCMCLQVVCRCIKIFILIMQAHCCTAHCSCWKEPFTGATMFQKCPLAIVSQYNAPLTVFRNLLPQLQQFFYTLEPMIIFSICEETKSNETRPSAESCKLCPVGWCLNHSVLVLNCRWGPDGQTVPLGQ